MAPSMRRGRGPGRRLPLSALLLPALLALAGRADAEASVTVHHLPFFQVYKYHGVEFRPLTPVATAPSPAPAPAPAPAPTTTPAPAPAPTPEYGPPPAPAPAPVPAYGPPQQPASDYYAPPLGGSYNPNTQSYSPPTYSAPYSSYSAQSSASSYHIPADSPRSGRALPAADSSNPADDQLTSDFGNFAAAASDAPVATEAPEADNSSDLGVLNLFGGNDEEDTGSPFDILDMAAILGKYLPNADGKGPLRTSIRITGPSEVQLYPKLRASPVRVDITAHDTATKKPTPAPAQERKDSLGLTGTVVKSAISKITDAGIGKAHHLLGHKKTTLDLADLGVGLAKKAVKGVVKDLLKDSLKDALIPPFPFRRLPKKEPLDFDAIGSKVLKSLITKEELNPIQDGLKLLSPIPHFKTFRTNLAAQIATKVVGSTLKNIGPYRPKTPFALKNVGKDVVKYVIKDAIKHPLHTIGHAAKIPIKTLGHVIKHPLGHLGHAIKHPLGHIGHGKKHAFGLLHHGKHKAVGIKDLIPNLAKGVAKDLVKGLFFGKKHAPKNILGLLKGAHKLNPLHILLAKGFVDSHLGHGKHSLGDIFKHTIVGGKLGIHPLHVIIAKSIFDNLLKDPNFSRILLVKPKVATVLFASYLFSNPIFALGNIKKVLTLAKLNAYHGGAFEKLLLKKVALILALAGKVASVKATLWTIPVMLAHLIGEKVKSLKLAAASIPLALHAILSVHPLAFHLISNPILSKLPLVAKIAILKHHGLSNLHLALIVALFAHPTFGKLLYPLLAIMAKYPAITKLPLVALLPVLTNPLVSKLLLSGLLAPAAAAASVAVPASLLKDSVLSKLPVSILAAFSKHSDLLKKIPVAVLIPILKTAVGKTLLIPLLAVFTAFPSLTKLPLPLLLPILLDAGLTKLLLGVAAAAAGAKVKAGATAGLLGLEGLAGLAALSGLVKHKQKPEDVIKAKLEALYESIKGVKSPAVLFDALVGGFPGGPGVNAEPYLASGVPSTASIGETEQRYVPRYQAIGSPYFKVKFPRPEIYIEALVHPRPTTTTEKPHTTTQEPSYGLPVEHREPANPAPTSNTYGPPAQSPPAANPENQETRPYPPAEPENRPYAPAVPENPPYPPATPTTGPYPPSGQYFSPSSEPNEDGRTPVDSYGTPTTAYGSHSEFYNLAGSQPPTDQYPPSGTYDVPYAPAPQYAAPTTERSPPSEYGPPAQEPQQPSQEYGTPAEPLSPANEYRSPIYVPPVDYSTQSYAPPPSQYGVPAAPAHEYGAPATPPRDDGILSSDPPPAQYGPPPANEYGTPYQSQPPQYSVSSQEPLRAEYGTPFQQSHGYSSSNPQINLETHSFSSFSEERTPVNEYGLPHGHVPSQEYGYPPQEYESEAAPPQSGPYPPAPPQTGPYPPAPPQTGPYPPAAPQGGPYAPAGPYPSPKADYEVPEEIFDFPEKHEDLIPDATGFAIPDTDIKDLFNVYSAVASSLNGGADSEESGGGFIPDDLVPFVPSNPDPYDAAAEASEEDIVSVAFPEADTRGAHDSQRSGAASSLTAGGYSRVKVQPVVARQLKAATPVGSSPHAGEGRNAPTPVLTSTASPSTTEPAPEVSPASPEPEAEAEVKMEEEAEAELEAEVEAAPKEQPEAEIATMEPAAAAAPETTSPAALAA